MEFGQNELDELLKYIQHLENENQQLKATAITLQQQRNSALRKYKELNERVHKPLVESKTEDIDFEEL